MATSNTLPDPPVQLKAISSYMRIASDIERIDPVVSYWVRLYSTETALKIDRDSPECKTFLGAIILWLEKFKQSHKEDDMVNNQTVGQAHFENFVVALFTKADTLDREGTANKNTVRMFFMAAVLFEAMAVFGPLTEEVSKKAKYAKFKAAYIQKCLKAGQTPKPGPVEGSDLEDPSAGNAPTGTADSSSDPNKEQKAPEVPPGDSSASIKNDPFVLTPSSSIPSYPRPSQPPAPPSTPPTGYSEPSKTPQAPAHAPPPCPASTPNSSFNSSATQVTSSSGATRFNATNGMPLDAEDIIQGQKYCKFANSALQYDDIPTAVANLEKALKLLTTGQKPD